MDNNKRQKMLIITVAVIIGLWVGYAIVFTPLMASWEARNKKIDDLKQKVAEGNALMKHRDEVLDKWDRYQADALTNDLSQAQSALVKAVGRWAQNSGVTTDSIQPQVRSDPDENNRDITITTVECRVDATGTMNSILSFLYAIGLEKMGTRLDNVEIATKDNTGQQLTLGVTISALVLGVEQPANNNTPAPAPASTE